MLLVAREKDELAERMKLSILGWLKLHMPANASPANHFEVVGLMLSKLIPAIWNREGKL